MTLSKGEEETYNIAKQTAEKIKNGGLLCLFGDLGTGKTVFTKGIAEALGINSFTVKSPTYTYIREYEKSPHKIYHIDLYRLDSIDELLLHEINEILNNKNNIVIIEWADKMLHFLPKERIDIHFKYIDENTRELTF